MSAHRPRHVACAALALVALLASARSASASGPRAPLAPLAWWVDVACAETDGERARDIRREVELACEAAGRGCVLAHDAASATHRARVTCSSDGAWSLDAETVSGAHLWAITLDAPLDDRSRSAALWIARTDAEAEPPPSPPAVEPANPAGVLAPHDARFALSFALRGTLRGSLAPATVGLRAAAAYVLPKSISVSLIAGGERAASAPSGYALTAGSVGCGLGLGAPARGSPLGIGVEAGALIGQFAAPADVAPGTRGFVVPYGQLAVIAQWPGRNTPSQIVPRPWIAVSLLAQGQGVALRETASTLGRLPPLAAALDVGAAWSL